VLVEVTRGAGHESLHRGHLALMHPDGTLESTLGDAGFLTSMRSSAKPFQAVPLITSGAADHFSFTEKEVAIACGSHHGETEQTETVAGMLKKIGLGPGALKCGLHKPFSAGSQELMDEGGQPRVLQNNCSGKHASMLAMAVHLKAPTGTYDQPDHPVQKLIRDCVSEFSGVPASRISLGVDGCGVPVFSLPISAMALMAARLVAPPKWFSSGMRNACHRIVSAMTSYPEMVGGHFQSLDTDLMKWTSGALISKSGAEGVYLAGIRPGGRWPDGLGLAFKIEDGDKANRARGAVALEALRQLGLLDKVTLKNMGTYLHSSVRNNRGEKVGLVRTTFVLPI
jgi:L-asparaginase II